jgi:type I restriction enzyme S subunit
MSSGEVNDRLIKNTKEKITRKGMKNSNAKLLPANTVMIALNGQGKTKGMVAILCIPSTCNQSLAAIICETEKIDFFIFISICGVFIKRFVVWSETKRGMD